MPTPPSARPWFSPNCENAAWVAFKTLSDIFVVAMEALWGNFGLPVIQPSRSLTLTLEKLPPFTGTSSRQLNTPAIAVLVAVATVIFKPKSLLSSFLVKSTSIKPSSELMSTSTRISSPSGSTVPNGS